ncbi:hypothetical protein AYI70_g8366 [Smittium culicis]|uniref:Uncharacterized protein n=1 Tax=Smittium culicis TaxID=133412 RepID=A0A1R1XGD3_9FUNG|nr:hypothetical protein AYI70_g8366 [Smittium culicis]
MSLHMQAIRPRPIFNKTQQEGNDILQLFSGPSIKRSKYFKVKLVKLEDFLLFPLLETSIPGNLEKMTRENKSISGNSGMNVCNKVSWFSSNVNSTATSGTVDRDNHRPEKGQVPVYQEQEPAIMK